MCNVSVLVQISGCCCWSCGCCCGGGAGVVGGVVAVGVFVDHGYGVVIRLVGVVVAVMLVLLLPLLLSCFQLLLLSEFFSRCCFLVYVL